MPASASGNCIVCGIFECSRMVNGYRDMIKRKDEEISRLETQLQMARAKRRESSLELEEYLRSHSLKGSQRAASRHEVHRGNDRECEYIAQGLRALGKQVEVISVKEPGKRNWAKVMETLT